MTSKFKAALAAVCTAALLAACGGGGGIGGTGPVVDNNAGTPGGIGGTGTGGTGVAFGTVSGYGSVIINGVHYEDNGVTITKADDSKVTGDGASTTTRSALPIGSLVRVDFNGTTTALGFKVDDSISGRIESVVPGVSVTVMGQTVRIDDTTSQYEDNVLRTGGVALAQGNFVRIQGQADDKGGLLASYVNKLSASGTLFEVKGVVSGHNPTAGTFSVGSLNVTYSSSTTTSDMPPDNWNGLVVEVKGSNCSNLGSVCGTLTATKVEPDGGLSSSSSTSKDAEIEGIVAAVVLGDPSTGVGSFKIGNTTVAVTTSTRWEGGTRVDFAVGVKLEAEGKLANGVLTASKVSLRDGSRLEGNITGLATSNGVTSFKLAGLPNVTIKANSSTSFKSGTLGGLANSNHLRVRGRVSSDGTTVVATEVDVRSASADNRLEIRGLVTAVSGTTLTILGTSVNVNGLSFSDSRSSSSGTSVSMTQAAFLAAAKAGVTVKLRSDTIGATWKEAELESD
ncbi:hypothetical protein BurJ1DRAFT_3980 [Burkholderiales bacterium JOSHI_001]|nr:hypothetical protein BurJ1DRAFT_3980 [Burkholderiales bacterium JOSHI_001]